MDLCNRVVVYQRSAHCSVGGIEAEPLHQARRIHVAVAHTNSRLCQALGHSRGPESGKIEALVRAVRNSEITSEHAIQCRTVLNNDGIH